jgi:alpha-galactosidase/6-phospho-beta-glucosidase family protein
MKAGNKSPKLVVIGAGSIFFTRAVAIGMCQARIYADRYETEIFGEMPPVLRSWLLRVVDVQELTLKAALTGSRLALRQALLADPLTVSFEDIDHIIADLFKAESNDLPSMWAKDAGRR